MNQVQRTHWCSASPAMHRTSTRTWLGRALRIRAAPIPAPGAWLRRRAMLTRLGQLLELVLPVAVAAAFVARLAEVWAARLGWPYDLEWMEGGMLAHSWRLAEGLPLYVEPGPEFVPFVYPPGYAALV